MPKKSPNARFLEKVDKRGENDCWNWTACKSASGHGKFTVAGRTWYAHRYSYDMHRGAFSSAYIVRHKCDNPSCCNPKHLELGTHQDNMNDMVSRNRSLTGSKNPTSKLTEQDVQDIRQRFSQGETGASILQDYPVGRSQLSRIKLGKKWKDS